MTGIDPRSVACPTCRAGTGLPCIGERGTTRASNHAARVQHASMAAEEADAQRADARRREREQSGRTKPEPWCRCRQVGLELQLCEEHRRIGLEAIALIRQRQADRGAA